MTAPGLTAEQLAALRRAFVDRRADFIVVDGWTNPWLRDCAAAAEAAGLLESSFGEGDQYSALVYRLAPGGRDQLEAGAYI